MKILDTIKDKLPSRKGNKVDIRNTIRIMWRIVRFILKWAFYIAVIMHLIFTYLYKDPESVQARDINITSVEIASTASETKIDQPTESREQTVKRLVDEVLNGKHGNGTERKNSLGEYYDEVQKIVDRKVNSSSSNKVTKNNNIKASKEQYQQYAHSLVMERGWSENDYDALVKLWNKESGWNANAHNKSSGAHGIPQALPASKMASEGSDYYTNGYTQIRWGIKYIANRYKTPSNAWQHFLNKGWY